jgi:hypothetical protein
LAIVSSDLIYLVIFPLPVLFLTRNGSEFRVPYLEEIINKALLMYPELDNYVLIGELLSYNNGIVEDRKTGNGKITK